MPRHTIQKRMPVSCENCRKRKIACAGKRAPCHTCTRRGFASTCHFIKEPLPAPQAAQGLSSSEHESLLNRLSTLERLLQANIDSTRKTPESSARHEEHSITPPAFDNRPESSTRTHTGRLVHFASGHVRYVLADHAFQELLQEGSVDAASPIYSQSTDFPFSTATTATMTEILELLPPLSYCSELKLVFMNVFSPLFHVLHDPTFEEEYHTFTENPNGTSLSFLALLFVVLAIAITALDESDPILADLGRESTPAANARSIAARFRNAAMRALSADSFLWRHNLRTLQALVLLIYAISHAHGTAWTLLGTTLNIAIAIGCHVDPSKYDVSVIEGEERRRCWAALTMLYTIQNTCMGNLSPMKLQADVQLPADVDDDVLSNIHPDDTLHERLAPTIPSKMAYILFKFKLYNLASEICALSASGSWDQLSALRLDRKVATQESIQRARFGDLEAVPVYHQAHYYILSSYTNHLYLILHRPYLQILRGDRDSMSLPSRAHEPNVSLSRSYRASLSILESYEALHATEAFRPYKWYTHGLGSFHAFLAVTTLGSLIRSQATTMKLDVRYLLGQLNRCLQRFTEASERSDVCAKSARILHRFLATEAPLSQDRSQHHDSSAGFGHNHGAQRYVANTQVSPPGDGFYEHPGGELMGTANLDFAAVSSLTSLSAAEGTDLDRWMGNCDLQDAFAHIPTQQWLSPSSFPWWRWYPDDPIR